MYGPVVHPLAGTGRVIAGRYRLEESIGRGAMGVVWRARDLLLDRDVAVKEVQIRETVTADERSNAYQRTLREAKTAARLSHPGVVTVYDVAEEDGRPWIVMELVSARSLDQVIAADGPLTARRVAELGRQLLAALATAHAAGVMHRDVKPSNVLLDGDRAVLTDFGIATFTGDPRLTQTGMVMGSPGFTAPERIRGQPASPASDLWSLGATLYTAVEGHGPYERRGGAITTMSAIINESAPLAPSAGALNTVIAALLRREPQDRPDPATAARMIADVLPMLPDRYLGPPTRHNGTAAAGSPAAGGAEAGGAAGSPAAGNAALVADASATSADAAMEASTGTEPPTLPSHYPVGRAGRPARTEAPQPARVEAAQARAEARQPGRTAAPPPGSPTASQPVGAGRRRGRGKILLAAIAVVVAAAAGVTTTLLLGQHSANPSAASSVPVPPPSGSILGAFAVGPQSGPLPTGWHSYTVQPSGAGTTAGFSIGLPDNWTTDSVGTTNSEVTTKLEAPDAGRYLEVDLTQHKFADMVTEAEYIERNALAKGDFPGYKRIKIQPVILRHTDAALWEFTWEEAGVGEVHAWDLLFIMKTPAGLQSYALYLTAPASIFRTTPVLRIFDEELRTFSTVP
jgi:hypothetical protein